jgi:hypothetical protein
MTRKALNAQCGEGVSYSDRGRLVDIHRGPGKARADGMRSSVLSIVQHWNGWSFMGTTSAFPLQGQASGASAQGLRRGLSCRRRLSTMGLQSNEIRWQVLESCPRIHGSRVNRTTRRPNKVGEWSPCGLHGQQRFCVPCILAVTYSRKPSISGGVKWRHK